MGVGITAGAGICLKPELEFNQSQSRSRKCQNGQLRNPRIKKNLD